MSYACQLQSFSSLNEFRISKWRRFESELLQIMRNSKTKKNDNFETFCREAKMTVCVCLSQYVCAWGSDEKRWFYDYESHVSSIWAPNSQLLPVLTVAQQRDEIIAQRFQYGTSPVGAVVLFGLCLPGRGAKHSRAFWGQGGQKWRFGRFYEISNFHDKIHLRSRIGCIASRKQKSTMFYLKRSSRFDNS